MIVTLSFEELMLRCGNISHGQLATSKEFLSGVFTASRWKDKMFARTNGNCSRKKF